MDTGFVPFIFERVAFEAEIGKLRALASQLPDLPDMEGEFVDMGSS